MAVLPLRRSKDDTPDPGDIVLGDIDPEYGKLHSLQQSLYARQVELTNEGAAVAWRIRAEGSKAGNPRMAPGVAKLLGVEDDAAITALNVREGEIQAELRDIRAALAELDGPIHQARSRASFAACMQLKPRHDHLVAQMADAMRALGKAQDDLCTFYRSLDSAGIQRGSLPPQLLHHLAGGALFEWIRDRRMHQDIVSRWFQYVQRCGFKMKE